ncbi:hypothetical protein ACROYT_G001645 [Oculina patagonica]
MRINARNQEKITINGQDIEDVNEFVYLGAKVCKEGGGMKDLKNRLSKARGAFNKLKIWISNNILRKTKLRLYKTLVSETWKMNKGDEKAVDVCLRKILRIRWQDRVSTKELLERAGMEPLSEEVKSRRWKIIGHILWKDRNDDCNVAISWAPEGKRRRGRPKTTWSRTCAVEKVGAHWRKCRLIGKGGKAL